MLQLERAWVMRLVANDVVDKSGGVQSCILGGEAWREKADVPGYPVIGETADGGICGTLRFDQGPGAEEGGSAVED